ncbi:MAG: hypothetical protein QOE06_2129 [Thermoleophilaceae bacterium]|nr:hypothetical protein [Thermoleophilaceae bacterium]
MARTRSRMLVLLGLAAGGLLLLLAAIDNRMWDEGGPGIVGFELAWTTRHADRILAEWGPHGRDAARLSLWLDFLYIAAYSAFWALAARAARDFAGRAHWHRLAALGALAWPLGLAAGLFDVLEDIALLIVLGGSTGQPWPALASAFATLKFLAFAGVGGYVAIVLVRRFPRTAIGLAALAAVVLAVNTWTVDRETRPARADIGRIVHVPGGDIQVREDGPRDGPPVVLIHGFACSLRWWDGVVPALSRRLHVVRLDLLGHGGSEKPRRGYSMENQADIVAAVMQKLGIRRAPVVGHSMGGMVGTAMVERHPRMVARLMMIGTAVDAKQEQLDLLDRAAFLPVIAEANDRLISDRVVRWVLERGFAPEFDPPRYLIHDIFGRTTVSSFGGSARAITDFWDDRPLQQRLAGRGVPVTVLLGERERHSRRSARLYDSVRGIRAVVMKGLDHTPMVESPARTEPLIEAFARG